MEEETRRECIKRAGRTKTDLEVVRVTYIPKFL